MCEPKTEEQLFKTHGEKLMNELNDNCDSWLVHSHGREVLDKIAADAGNSHIILTIIVTCYDYFYIFLEYVILSNYEVYWQILVKTLQNIEKDSKFLMKILININICVDKNIFVDKQLWQILSGKIFV